MFTHVSSFEWVTLIVGTLLPIVVALVTKYESSPAVKAVLLLVLSGVASVLNSWLNTPHGFDWSQAVFGAVTTFVVGTAALFGLWKPTTVNERAKRSLVR